MVQTCDQLSPAPLRQYYLCSCSKTLVALEVSPAAFESRLVLLGRLRGGLSPQPPDDSSQDGGGVGELILAQLAEFFKSSSLFSLSLAFLTSGRKWYTYSPCHAIKD